MNCPICETDEKVVDVPTMEYALGCNECGAVWRRNMPTPEELEKFYTKEYPKIWHKNRKGGTRPLQRTINRGMRLCHLISQFVEVPPFLERHLDIGCGSCLLLGAVHQMFGGCQSVGVEKGDYPMTSFISRTDEKPMEIYKRLDQVPGTFDLITLSHFLEHVTNPSEWLRNVHPMLRDKGLIIVEVPNVCGEPTALPPEKESWIKAGLPPPHLIGYSQYTLNYMMTKAGYFVREVQTSLPLECRTGEFVPSYITAIATKSPMGQVQNTVKRNFSQLVGSLPHNADDPHPRLAFTPMWNIPAIQDHLHKQIDRLTEVKDSLS